MTSTASSVVSTLPAAVIEKAMRVDWQLGLLYGTRWFGSLSHGGTQYCHAQLSCHEFSSGYIPRDWYRSVEQSGM